MGDSDQHLKLAREKLSALQEAYRRHQHTVVGDLAIKVVEQLVEADAAGHGMHFGICHQHAPHPTRDTLIKFSLLSSP